MIFAPLPLWLLLDPVACVTVLGAFWRFIAAFWPAFFRTSRKRGARLKPEDLAGLSPLLAELEAALAWAIARRARQLLNLPPDEGEPRWLPPPSTQAAFARRMGACMTLFGQIDAAALRRARRIRASLGSDPLVSLAWCTRGAGETLIAPWVFWDRTVRGGLHARAPPRPTPIRHSPFTIRLARPARETAAPRAA